MYITKGVIVYCGKMITNELFINQIQQLLNSFISMFSSILLNLKQYIGQ